MEIIFEESALKKRKPDQNDLSFGKNFTDHMFLMEWLPETGWQNARIKPYEPFQIEPGALVFHYGQEIFEGLKAYHWSDKTVALFRPEANAARFNSSAVRLCMPEVPLDLFVRAIGELVAIEREWIPTAEQTSLYIRPTMIAVESILGVRPASHYYFFIILSPVGPYYPTGFKPIKIWVEDKYVRAVKGGMGEAKTGGNYASSLKANLAAKQKGCEQVLWLDGIERRYVEEVGAMNMFFVRGTTLITPPLDGAILHGITRDAILQLAKSFKIHVEERKIEITQLINDIKKGIVNEAFGSGTAAVVTPVSHLNYKDEVITIGDGKTGPLARKFYETLTGIQYGKIPDTFGWIKRINLLNLAPFS